MVPRNAHRQETLLSKLSNCFFLIMGIFLSITAISVLCVSIWRTILCLYSDCDLLTQLFNQVGHLIIGVAVFDVGRYLIEEEVLRDRELRSPTEARRSLTKFMVIIVIAVTLESLVAVIKASMADIRMMVYPALLLFVATLLLVGLGVYQRLSVLAEQHVNLNKEVD